MISILAILGTLMAITLPMALGYVGLITMAAAGVFYGAIYAINYGFYLFNQKDVEEFPWLQNHDKAS